jgi:hypothetical protein
VQDCFPTPLLGYWLGSFRDLRVRFLFHAEFSPTYAEREIEIERRNRRALKRSGGATHKNRVEAALVKSLGNLCQYRFGVHFRVLSL